MRACTLGGMGSALCVTRGMLGGEGGAGGGSRAPLLAGSSSNGTLTYDARIEISGGRFGDFYLRG